MWTAPSGTTFTPTLHSVYPHLTTVGEIFNGDPEVTSFFAGGVAHDGIDTGLDTPFDFPVYFALRDVLAHGQTDDGAGQGSAPGCALSAS